MSGIVPANMPSQFDPLFQQPDLSVLPQMPVATDDNLIQAVNAIRQVVQQLGAPKTLPTPPPQRPPPPGSPKNKQNDKKKNPPDKVRFTETQRKTSKQRVYNTQDNTQYIEFDQIDFLEFTDKVTGATIIWSR